MDTPARFHWLARVAVAGPAQSEQEASELRRMQLTLMCALRAQHLARSAAPA